MIFDLDQFTQALQHNKGGNTMNHAGNMMNQTDGWMGGWMGGGTWIWTVIGVLVVVLLVVVISKLSKK